jgi:DNA-binding LacI/PurR family transcriptional regulator
MSVSQQAIAERLGLSTATISRSLSGNSRISSQTQARVLNAAKAMGYDFDLKSKRSGRPDRAARLSSREAHSGAASARDAGSILADRRAIAVSLLSFGRPSVHGAASVVRNRILSGMIEECRARELMLTLDYVDANEAERLADPAMLPAAVRSGQSQGVLITGRFPDQAVAQLCNHLPCVQVADYCPSRSVDCIDHDDMRSVELIVDHLWAQGHRRIGFVGGEKGHTINLIRANAFDLAMLRRGLAREDLSDRRRDSIADSRDPEAAFGWVRAAIADRVTGWVVANDGIGYRMLNYLAEQGVQCPRDISLCGFDHLDPPDGLPRLTSIDAPFEDMGRLAVTRLHHRIRQTVVSTYHTMVECRLRRGESTRPVPR